ncbi:IS200/IS605 family transposase, partial [Blautia obeum]|uniref:IS200/IS605 family transposase n=1 Tax=Blautia obeum TaxID=40520 RepID=UPI001FA90994
YVYSLQYHLVWCTKYRKKVLKDGIDAECKKMLYDLAEEYKFQILAMEVMPDHINKNMDKNMFNINNNELSYGRGYVYSLQYHLVWCTK